MAFILLSTQQSWAQQVITITSDTDGQQAIVAGGGLIVEEGVTITHTGDTVTGTTIGSINNAGTILSTAGDGIATTSINSPFENFGRIEGQGRNGITLGVFFTARFNNVGDIIGSVNGIESTLTFSSSGDFLNSGTIMGNSGAGIRIAGGDLSELTNRGIIRGDTYGILSIDALSNFINSGDIIGNREDGIEAGALSNFINSGDIRGGGNGITITSAPNFVNQAGGIIQGGVFIPGGPSRAGISIRNGRITNAGIITGAFGIGGAARGNLPITIINSGTITGTDGIAINLVGNAADELTFSGNSIINGIISIEDQSIGGDQDTITFRSDLTRDITLEFNSDRTAENLNVVAAEGFVVTQIGRFLGIFRPTSDNASVGSVHLFFSDTIRTVFNALDARLSSADSSSKIWASAFSGEGELAETSNLLALSHSYVGGIEGGELRHESGSTSGFLGGGLRSTIKNSDTDLDVLDTGSAFFGVYHSRKIKNLFANLAFVTSWANFENSRLVGDSQENAKFNGISLTPSLTLGAFIKPSFVETPFRFSVRADYAMISTEAYTELGGVIPLTVGEREVETLNVRTQLDFPHLRWESKNIDFGFQLGSETQSTVSSQDIAGSFADDAVSFSSDVEDTSSVFYRGSVAYISENGLSLTTAVESRAGALTGSFNFTKRF